MKDLERLPLSVVCSQMETLVCTHGWALVRSQGIPGYNTTASIEKSGVVISYSYSKGDRDFGVALTSEVHPALGRELDRQPTLLEVLSAIGVKADYDDVLLRADEDLSAIKGHLIDPDVWEQRVAAATADLVSRYASWSTGPEFTRDLAASLAERHPWLTTGRVPHPNELRLARMTSVDRIRCAPRGIIIGVVAISVIIAHYLS